MSCKQRLHVAAFAALLAGCAQHDVHRGTVEEIGLCDEQLHGRIWSSCTDVVQHGTPMKVCRPEGFTRLIYRAECRVRVDGEWWYVPEREARALEVGQPVTLKVAR